MPLPDHRGQNIPYAVITDSPNAQTLAQSIVTAIVDKLVLTYNSANHRGASIPTPVAGMVSWLRDVRLLQLYDGSQWVTIATGATAWTTLNLRAGYTHNGNSNGNAQYRLVNLFGEPTIMFRGGVNIAYAAGGALPNDGWFLTANLPVAARPAQTRSVLAACSHGSSEQSAARLDGVPDGRLRFLNKVPSTPPWISLTGVMYSL